MLSLGNIWRFGGISVHRNEERFLFQEPEGIWGGGYYLGPPFIWYSPNRPITDGILCPYFAGPWVSIKAAKWWLSTRFYVGKMS
jgi:hypothetical protein